MLTSLGVAVIDYDAGNTLSVTRALEKVGARVNLTPDPERVARADAVVLPGVGERRHLGVTVRPRSLDERSAPTSAQSSNGNPGPSTLEEGSWAGEVIRRSSGARFWTWSSPVGRWSTWRGIWGSARSRSTFGVGVSWFRDDNTVTVR